MTSPAPTTAPGVSPATTDRRRLAHRTRGVALWVLALVLGGALIAFAAGTSAPEDYLHPDGTGQGGTRALVEVLRDQGVDVEVAGTAEEAADDAGTGTGTTVVVGNSDLLTTTAARRLLRHTTGADRVVFLDGAPSVLGDLGLGLAVGGAPGPPEAAECDVPWVRPGDRLDRVSFMIAPSGDALPSGARGCYPLRGADAGGPTGWASVDLPATSAHAPVTVVGFPDAATNRFVTEADHAGLVVRLLGASPRLVWYHPSADDITANPAPPGEGPVWPDWLTPVALVVAAAFVAFAVARGRRLGRLVPEDLPVVVRATETTESRAELYRAAGDRARAATVLRRATTGRLAGRLGVTPGVPFDVLIAAVADASAVPTAQVDALLRDTPPSDEAALVVLAQQLSHLEEKVRTS